MQGAGPEPPYARDALVFTLVEPESVPVAVDRVLGRRPFRNGLEAVLEYVERYRHLGAELTPLYPDRSLGVLSDERGSGDVRGWRVAIPDQSSRRQGLSAFHHLRLATGEEVPALVNAVLVARLRSDPRRLVYHPAIPRAWDPPPQEERGDLGPQWAIEKCGFHKAWDQLEKGDDPGPILVVDDGRKFDHPELERVQELPLVRGTPSGLAHASGVTGVLAARRDDKAGINGCCSATVQLINVATTQGIDPLDFYCALRKLAKNPPRVINVSLFMAEDPLVRCQVAELVASRARDGAEQKVIVVAAMGNDGERVKVFPAGYPGVIAVGATNRNDVKLAASNTGDHIYISAPGEYIRTVSGPNTFDDVHGTSYATPMVSAAAWLAMRARPEWSADMIKNLLSLSVHRKGQLDEELGYGRLDMCEMLHVLGM